MAEAKDLKGLQLRWSDDGRMFAYAKKGEEVVKRNWAAVDLTLENLHKVEIPASATAKGEPRPVVPANAPDFVQRITAVMMEGKGDLLPVSAFAPDGTWPTGTTQWERRNIALEIPVWDESLCIQCGKCVMVCPHSVIRAKVYAPALLEGAPPTFKAVAARWKDFKDQKYTLQVAPEDCTGCAICIEVCPWSEPGRGPGLSQWLLEKRRSPAGER